jgi:NAD(P)-dependent dehydrogenase (short-subunit alcohol dehydrogenase family)
MMNFDNKVVLISGSGTGIGKAAAKAFLANGAKVVLNGRRQDVLEKTASELEPSSEIAIVVGDIGAIETSKEMVAIALERFGGVDILINNAGIFKPTPFLDHTEEDFNAYIAIMLKGTFFGSQAAIPEMQKRGGGVIVNIGSMWAIQAIEATPSSAYSAAKAGIHALTRNLAIEFAKDNIRVNAVAPAIVETPVYETFMSPEEVRSVLPTFNTFHPLGRNGQPQDVVEAILYLASDRASWVTGVVLPVDGGVTAGRTA